MANKQNTEKTGFFAKVGRFFKTLGPRIWQSLKNMYYELKNVTWPTRSNLINYTLVVLAFIVVMGVVVFIIDLGSSALMSVLTR